MSDEEARDAWRRECDDLNEDSYYKGRSDWRTLPIALGFVVCVKLRRGIGGEMDGSAYVGSVEAIDDHGLRLTLIQWSIGTFSGYDLYVPWRNVEMAYVATPDHHLLDGQLGRWQRALTDDDKRSPEPNDRSSSAVETSVDYDD